LGIASGKNIECFNTFFRKLGRNYKDLLDKHGNIYGKIRNGIVHGYLIEGNSKVVIEGEDCGIAFDDKTGVFTFYVGKYLEDLKFAVNQYIYELKTDLDKFNNARQSLENVAQLI